MRISFVVIALVMGAGLSAFAQEAAPILTDLTMEVGDNGKQLVDKGPLGLKGELNAAATLVDGKTGKALQFVGKEESIKFDSHWTIDNLNKQLSLSVWIKPEQRPQGDIMFIVAKRPGWWTGTPYALGFDRDGRISAVCNDGSDHWIHSNAAMETGTWHQIVLTFEAGKQFSMYVDGVRQNERADVGKLRGNTEPLTLGYVKGGNFPGGNYQAYKGDVDALRIFPVCLSDAQVKQEFAGKLVTRLAEQKDYPKRGMDPKDIPAEVSLPPASNTPLECSIVFDQQPKAQGMWYESLGGQLREVEVDGKKTWCLVAGQATGMAWAKSAKFTLTDPRFKNGLSPAVDFELTYMDKAWAPVEMTIDAKGSSRKIGGGWQSTKWTTVRISVDDAYFGNRDFGNPDSAILSDGYDLRVNGFNEDLCIRSIKIVGHDRTSNVDWKRMLRLTDITSGQPLLAFANTGSHQMNYQFDNLALKDAKLKWSWRLNDYAGKMIQQASGDATIAKSSKGQIRINLDSSKLPLGPYLVQFDSTMDNNGKTEPFVQRSGKLGIVSSTKLDKAAPGEFLYGIGNNGGVRDFFAWCDLMGIDINRGAGISLDGDNDAIITAHASHGMTVMPMFDPPQEGAPGTVNNGMEAGKRQGMLSDMGAKMQAFAKKYAGKVAYYELGNEPDLRFFYHGPIEEYGDSYKTMRQYIKKGDPKAVVMTGGLCFFGEGDARARKLIDILGPDDIDAWAYHGHGPLVGAERAAYERSRDQAAKSGDGRENKPYLETESGMAAASDNPGEQLLQARTCVQKMVYSQSLPMPAFFWFSLLIEGGDGGYTTTEGFGGSEPRAAALSYRNMVEQLRHMKFQKTLDLKVQGLEGYLFQGSNGKKTLVAWSNRPSITDVSLQLDSPQASQIREVDMFGNSPAARTQPGGFVNVFVGIDPVFVSWTSGGSLAAVKTVDSTIAADMPSPVFTGMPNVGYIVVRNPSPEPLNATVTLEAYSRVGIKVQPASIPVELKPGETKRVRVSLTLGEANSPLRLPRWWRVFTHTSLEKVDMAKLTVIPAELPGQKSATVKGSDVLVINDTINLSKLGSGSVEKDSAILLTTIYVPSDTTLKVGAGADWWMAWYCNGQRVFDTLTTGNNGASDRLKYTFDLPLKAGNNIIGCVVLSGSGGWSVTYGTEKEIAITNSGGIDPDRLVCKLVKDGKQLTEQVIPLDIERPVLTRTGLGADINAWQLTEPVAVLDSLSVTNLFEKFPDSSKWYKGETDISGTVWVNSQDDKVTFAVGVRDDKFNASASAEKLADGDSIELRLTDDAGKTLLQIACGLINDKPVMKQTGTNVAGVQATISSHDDLTFYCITVPRSLVGNLPAKLAVKLLDNDGYGLKQQAVIKGRTGDEGIRIVLK